jgi:hypothetical protein
MTRNSAIIGLSDGVRAIAFGTVEQWLPCPGYEDRYAVSSLGNIRSLRKGGGILSMPPNHDGYPHVCLRKDGKARVIQVHRLIALAFHAEKRNALHNEVAHLDGNRANARADNLKWVSKVENRSHRKLHGTETCGERHGGTLLKEAQVHAIRADKRRFADIAADFGISRYTVEDIKRRKRWIHLPERVSTSAGRN